MPADPVEFLGLCLRQHTEIAKLEQAERELYEAEVPTIEEDTNTEHSFVLIDEADIEVVKGESDYQTDQIVQGTAAEAEADQYVSLTNERKEDQGDEPSMQQMDEHRLSSDEEKEENGADEPAEADGVLEGTPNE
ncbi:unnamed protein product [Dicrocoelium dendriticum]|nr:unnamed protein product [Dicrocoelium dendriticum]CAH8594462.1 unnamed protein product [Dicrocoelium dendriticum]